MLLKVDINLTNAEEPVLRHKVSGQVHSICIHNLEVNQPTPAIPKDSLQHLSPEQEQGLFDQRSSVI